jgi:hypothetical protein
MRELDGMKDLAKKRYAVGMDFSRVTKEKIKRFD